MRNENFNVNTLAAHFGVSLEVVDELVRNLRPYTDLDLKNEKPERES